jgi:4-hydroxy-tetrahydrodipicolinate synthase
VQYSREAEAQGASGILVAPPYYSLPRPDELLEHVRVVDRAVGIPIMLYNFPGRTGVDMLPELMERMAELKNVRYVKDTTGLTTRISEIIDRCGDRLQVFCGCDLAVVEGFAIGAVGWVAGTANVCAAEHVELYRLLESKNYAAARELYYRLRPFLSTTEKFGNYAQMVKTGCRLTGRDYGPPRRPLLPPSEEEVESLRGTLALLRPAV